MKFEKINLVYFSPTGNTRKTVEGVAKGIGIKAYHHDLTVKESREEERVFTKDDLVIVGSPVYAGRIPEIEEGVFRGLKGDNTPVILIVNYGNREYEDSLLELKNIMKNQGFIPIAAGAFIGEHSYSTSIATNRPDKEDIEKMIDFGEKIKAILEGEIDLNNELKVSGNYPYKDGMAFMPFAPEANEDCTSCGLCVGMCPTEAILEDNPKETDATKCIKCFACIKICPYKAKSINVPPFKEKVKMIESICVGRRKEPETFII